MKEDWKAVPGWEGLYEVSNLGQARSVRLGRQMKPYADPRGYHAVSFCRDSKVSRKLMHRIVLEAFVGPCPEGLEGSHLDGNPRNNRVENLSWVTKKENMRHRDMHGTTSRGEHRALSVFKEHEVSEMRARLARGERRASIVREVVAEKGCDPTVVRDILGFRTWKHVK